MNIFIKMQVMGKWRTIGHFAGMAAGCALAYTIWGFSPPGGIIIIFCAALGGLIGNRFDKRRNGH